MADPFFSLAGKVAIVTGGGQGIGRIKEVLPAAQIVKNIAAEADAAVARVAAFQR